MDLKHDRWQRATAIASVLSVLAVGIGLIVTNDYNRDQQQLAQQGQITDRFTKAVEQLGQPGPAKVDVRLGGIYALQRIMRDSQNDQAAVVDILSAFVRVHAPAPARTGSSTEPLPPQVDTQAALTVLARRNPARDGEGRVDLSQTNLNRAAMPAADLRGAIFTGADLITADLPGANLSGANLIDADLSDTDLTGANLSGANLSGADLIGADLTDAVLAGTNLSGANLSGAKVTSEQLRCAYVTEATVSEGVVRPMPNAPLTDPSCK